MLNKIFFVFFQVLGIYVITFMLLHMIPGDPIQVMLGDSASLADQDKLREELGLNQPIFKQLADSLIKVTQGDFGYSIIQKTPVLNQLFLAAKNTYLLAVTSICIAIFFGVMGGILAAKYHNLFIDRFVMSLSILFISIPHFFLGPLLIIIFSIGLGWFPVSGMVGPYSIILPAFTLSLGLIAIIIKLTRNCMLELFESDIVRTAKAKGLGEWAVLIRHTFRLILIPVVSIVGMQFGSLLSGAVITETIFSWNGLGMLLVESIETRDYPITQACILVIALSYIIINIFTDLIYGSVDPRLRGGKFA